MISRYASQHTHRERERERESLPKTIGKNIRRLRKELSLTQEEFSAKLNVTNEYICRLEQGQHYPSIRLLEKIAALTEHQIQELFKK